MRCPHLHCQPLNEVWGGVDPGFSPSGPSGPLHAAELPWVGPAFPPGAPSLLQAVTQHFCYTPSTPPKEKMFQQPLKQTVSFPVAFVFGRKP